MVYPELRVARSWRSTAPLYCGRASRRHTRGASATGFLCKKDMIVSGGENVYSTEGENAIYSHPAVLEAAVIGVPDERWGEAVKAVVVLRPEHTLSSEEVIEHCKGQIAGHKLPKSVDFVAALPKSGAGKILKRELREPYWAGYQRRIH